MPRVPRVEQSPPWMPTAWPLIQVVHLFVFRRCQIHCLPNFVAAQEWFQWDHARGRRWRFRWFHGLGGCVSYGQKDLWVRERHGGAQRNGRWNRKLARKAGKLPNREDVRTHLTISNIHIIIDLQYTHVYKLCVYTILLYIHICTHICYILYRLITCLNLSILLYIVRTCNICQWHVTILGSPVAPRWFGGDLGPMVTHQYGSWRRVAWRSQNGWMETGPTVGIADGWLNSFFFGAICWAFWIYFAAATCAKKHLYQKKLKACDTLDRFNSGTCVHRMDRIVIKVLSYYHSYIHLNDVSKRSRCRICFSGKVKLTKGSPQECYFPTFMIVSRRVSKQWKLNIIQHRGIQ